MDNAAAPQASGRLTAAIAFARREPGKVLALVIAFNIVVWTILPILVCPNLQLDLAEGLALGKEWQLGYWKHPPLPWWTVDLLYQVTGELNSIYLLGPIASALCFYGVWLLAREVVGAFKGLIAVMVLEGIHFYNFSAVKFAHDQMQLPFWAFTALFFYRALKRGGTFAWILSGVCLAGAFWAKYAAFALAATFGLILIFDPMARRTWRTSGPYVMALTFAVVIAPNAWWLVESDFMPFNYVNERARAASHWYHYVSYPLQWTGSQAFFLLPAMILLALLYVGWKGEKHPHTDRAAGFDRRYVTALALGPFAVTTFVALMLGRLPVAMWGYPLWSFAPLMVLMWLPPVFTLRREKMFATGFIIVLLAVPVIYAGVEIFEPFLRDRPKATQFPGQRLATTIDQAWHEKYGTPLVYVGGTEFATNNVAVYAPDHPHVIVHGDPKLSPWVDLNDLHRRGAILVWEEGLASTYLNRWHDTFPDIEVQPMLVLPRQTWHPVSPAHVIYAFVPPRP